MQLTIDLRDDTILCRDKVVMENEIMQPQYKSRWDTVALALAAMGHCTLLEIIGLGGGGGWEWHAQRLTVCL